jgi:hypothetical protein
MYLVLNKLSPNVFKVGPAEPRGTTWSQDSDGALRIYKRCCGRRVVEHTLASVGFDLDSDLSWGRLNAVSPCSKLLWENSPRKRAAGEGTNRYWNRPRAVNQAARADRIGSVHFRERVENKLTSESSANSSPSRSGSSSSIRLGDQNAP